MNAVTFMCFLGAKDEARNRRFFFRKRFLTFFWFVPIRSRPPIGEPAGDEPRELVDVERRVSNDQASDRASYRPATEVAGVAAAQDDPEQRLAGGVGLSGGVAQQADDLDVGQPAADVLGDQVGTGVVEPRGPAVGQDLRRAGKQAITARAKLGQGELACGLADLGLPQRRAFTPGFPTS